MNKQMKKLAQRQVEVVSAYHKAFSGPAGELVLMDLMQTHWVLKPSMTKDIDPLHLAFREGERNAVLRIMAHLKIDPRQLLERIENHEREME